MSTPDPDALQQYRSMSGLDAVPLEIGAALRATSGAAQRQATTWLTDGCEFYQAQSPALQQLTRLSIQAAINEFAHLASSELPPGVSANTRFENLGHQGAAVGLGNEEITSLLQATARAIWTTLRGRAEVRGHEEQVQASLFGYLNSLFQTAARHLPPHIRADADIDDLDDHGLVMKQHLIARYGDTLVATHMVIHSPQDESVSTPTLSQSGEPLDDPPLRLFTDDHVVVLHPNPAAMEQYKQGLSGMVIHTSPVYVRVLGSDYAGTLLMFRLITFGLASPQSPMTCTLEDSDSTRFRIPLSELAELRDLLFGLLAARPQRRIDLARCLHQVLLGTRSNESHAEALGLSAGTLRNNLKQIRELLDHDLHFDASTTMQLLVVLPVLMALWQLELQQQQH